MYKHNITTSDNFVSDGCQVWKHGCDILQFELVVMVVVVVVVLVVVVVG